jgi:hypothetical protein
MVRHAIDGNQSRAIQHDAVDGSRLIKPVRDELRGDLRQR